MKLPLVSICLPTFNGEEYIREALESINSQTYKNIEVIISDDSSTDSTLKICHEFKETSPFPVHIYNHIPTGIGNNWNNCIDKANGKWIKLLFQDDIMEAECIEKMLNTAIKHNLECIVCKRKIIDNESLEIKSGEWYNNFQDLQKPAGIPIHSFFILSRKNIKNYSFSRYYFDNIVGEPCTSLFSKNLYRKIGPYNNKFKQILDYEYWLRVLRHFDIGIMPEKLIQFRVHEMQTSNVNNKNGISENQFIKDILFKYLFFYMNRKARGYLLMHKYPLYKRLFNLINKK